MPDTPTPMSDGTFTFGKYKGRAFASVAVSDPKYILWANSKGIVLPTEVVNMAQNSVWMNADMDSILEDEAREAANG